jgi:hypothetical protein
VTLDFPTTDVWTVRPHKVILPSWGSCLRITIEANARMMRIVGEMTLEAHFDMVGPIY